jgi:hypothetical protein
VTVLVGPRHQRFARLARRPGARGATTWIAVLAAAAALAGAVVGKLTDSGTTTPHARPAETGILAEQTAYRFPLGCLGVTLMSGSSLPAHDAAGRTGPCWHYGVYVTVVLRRIHGAWRLMLKARSASCPRVRLPAAIREVLAACAKAGVGARRSKLAPPQPVRRRSPDRTFR